LAATFCHVITQLKASHGSYISKQQHTQYVVTCSSSRSCS